MKHKIVFSIMAIPLILAMAACGGAATPTPAVAAPTQAVAAPTEAPAPTEAAPAETQAPQPSIALLLIGPKDDNSWAEQAYNALEDMSAKGVRTAWSENVADTDAARVMGQYIADGYNIIIAHSFSYQDAVMQVAKDNPNVNFAWAGGIQGTAKNVADYDQPFYEPSYIVGILAGYMSKSGHLGALYGFDIPVCHAMGEAMLAGAKTVNPNATLTVTAVGNWDDVAAAKEAALAQVDTAGVDYWIGCGEGPTLGSIQAAKQVGAYTTGYAGDMSSLGPDSVLASEVWNMDPIFQALYDQTVNGTFDNPWLVYGLADGAFNIVVNPSLADKVPQAATDAMNKALSDIKAGTLKVPYVPQ
jgi:basic membrane protein A